MNNILRICVLGVILSATNNLLAGDAIDLSGEWTVQLQKNDSQELWKDGARTYTCKLPGSLTENNIGDDVSLDTPWMGSTGQGGWKTHKKYEPYRQPGNIKVPFWLQPVNYFCGKAWYRRDVKITDKWEGKRIVLNLERCHWQSTVWVDGKKAGQRQDSLCTPHRYDLTELLKPGTHTLTVLIDNNYHVRLGSNAHSVTDHTQGNWNGIIGDISLTATDRVWLDDIQIFTDIDSKKANVKVSIGNESGSEFKGRLIVSAQSITPGASDCSEKATEQSVVIPADGKECVVVHDLGKDAPLWDEFEPNRIRLTVRLAGDDYNDEQNIEFGLRKISTEGRKFLVNGRHTVMRGNLDCAAFPITGHPPMDIEEWIRVFEVHKAYGFNHVRFHSWCPPEIAFKAADIVGIYIQPESATWRGSCPDDDARPIEPFLYDESKRIFKEYSNYASFVMFAHGNEPWELDKKWLNNTWTKDMKALDNRHLVTAGAQYPLGSENQFHIAGRAEGFKFRYHGFFNTKEPATTRNYASQVKKRNAPCISHEPGQWCAYPNLREIKKYTGVMRANNLEIVRDFMAGNHMLDQADAFAHASGRFQVMLYKECIEAFLRTRDIGGYQLLGLNDFPGQGTALVGVTDAFYDPKEYIGPEEYRTFNGPVVPLAEMTKRVWRNNETFEANITISQFSEGALKGVTPMWELVKSSGKLIAQGGFEKRDIEIGDSTTLGSVKASLCDIKTAEQVTLVVSIKGTDYRNKWDIWVYPEHVNSEAGDVLICKSTDEAVKNLKDGKKVLFAPGPDAFFGKTHGRFEAIFWNKAWFPGQKEHTLGLLVDNKHAALSNFPTRNYSQWQYWDLMMNYKPIVMDALNPDLRPIVQPIDDWNQCRRLGMLFEAKVGKGRLMVTSVDLENDMDNRPVARQFLASILGYMNSDRFSPESAMTGVQLEGLASYNPLSDLITGATVDSEQDAYGANNLFDGQTASFWHTAWKGNVPGYPHYIDISLKESADVKGISLLPRQDGSSNGMIKDIEIYVSNDGKNWGKPVAKARLVNNHEWKQVDFNKPVSAKHIKIKALSPQNAKHPWASLAEVDLLIE